MKTTLHIDAPLLLYGLFLVLVTVSAINSQNNLLFWIMGVMLAALLISAALSAFMLRGLQVRRMDPQHGVVGEPLMVRYAVTNRRRFLPAFDLHISELPPAHPQTWRRLMSAASAWVMHVGPKDAVHGQAVYWPRSRGEAHFHALRIHTRFPLGILARSITVRQAQHTLIYPRVHRLQPRVLASLVRPSLMGARVAAHAGGSDDYYGLREFRPSDSLRHISWKRTARTDQLVSVQRTAPSPSRLRIILDLRRSGAVEEAGAAASSVLDEEEAAISLAASVIHTADLAGFEIGLDVAGLHAPATSLRRGHWHVQKLLAVLASIDLLAPRTGQGLPLMREVERAALLIVQSGDIDPVMSRNDAVYLSARRLASLIVPEGQPLRVPRTSAVASRDDRDGRSSQLPVVHAT